MAYFQEMIYEFRNENKCIISLNAYSADAIYMLY